MGIFVWAVRFAIHVCASVCVNMRVNASVNNCLHEERKRGTITGEQREEIEQKNTHACHEEILNNSALRCARAAKSSEEHPEVVPMATFAQGDH